MEDAGVWQEVLVFLILGVLPWIFVGVGAWLIWSAHRFLAKAEQVKAKVVAVHEQSNTCRSNDHKRVVTTFRPVFAITDQDGEVRQVETFLSSSAYDFAIGMERKIMIDPDEPTMARVPGFMTYAFGGILVAGGLVLGVICMLVLSAL